MPKKLLGRLLVDHSILFDRLTFRQWQFEIIQLQLVKIEHRILESPYLLTHSKLTLLKNTLLSEKGEFIGPEISLTRQSLLEIFRNFKFDYPVASDIQRTAKRITGSYLAPDFLQNNPEQKREATTSKLENQN